VIQERLVSNSTSRDERFDDTNREIVRVSDVVMCLVRAMAPGRPGGTEELIARAVQRGKPVLVIYVDIADGKPLLTEQWHLPESNGRRPANPADAFELPTAPATLRALKVGEANLLQSISKYASAVKDIASPMAKSKQSRFKMMAKVIIGTHIIATILAATALGFAWLQMPTVIEAVLALELMMLGIGMVAHQWLHRTRIAHLWAEARLLAEVTRSVMAIGGLYIYMQYLFTLPFPRSIRPLLRTINVLHLQSTKQDKSPWQSKRDQYIDCRLRSAKSGQIDFYGRRAGESEERLRSLQRAFFVFWTMAFVSTTLKLVLHGYMEAHPDRAALFTGIMGTLAIVMPVLAVGALSLAAALDLEAQEHTYHEMGEFLVRQEQNLLNATSERDYADLVLETEAELLGEAVNWFSRRSFVAVS
jgi:hypothetical protein